MRFLLDKISKLDFGWNERPLTDADFYRLCKRFRITVEELPLATDGFYYRLMGRDCIAVDSRLSGPRKLAVLFHELGHFLFHVPDSGPAANFHGVGRRTRKEIEADVFALCALIPRWQIMVCSIDGMADDHGFPADILAARRKIFERYGL